ncbi:MAG: acyl-CoA desaturase [Planctomycetota bacterium]|nr:acyl-CoA desaturase [Planctomycetota bacterium]
MHKADWNRVIPFVVLHLSCLLVLMVGWSPAAVGFAVAFYGLRMFAITAFYHRYFSHRSFKTSRFMQFCFAAVGTAAVQRGPLWWAAHHRNHHRHSDQEGDAHSPRRDGLWHSHVGWILNRYNLRTRLEMVGDLAKYPELRFLDRFDLLVPILMIPLIYGLGAGLQAAWPGLETSGMQFLIWGFSISTVALYHVTFSINSLAHRLGSRRYETPDDSRNNLVLSVLTFGEGWHNNHHHYPGSVRMGFRWWEVDFSYYLIRLMAVFGLVWDLRPVPARIRKA